MTLWKFVTLVPSTEEIMNAIENAFIEERSKAALISLR
jgi:hypothetical protein